MGSSETTGIVGLRSQVRRLDRELSAAAAAINADAARRIAVLYAAGSERRARLAIAIALCEPYGGETAEGARKDRSSRTAAVDLVLGMLASSPGGRSTRELTGMCVDEGWSASAGHKAVERLRDAGIIEGTRHLWRLTPTGVEKAGASSVPTLVPTAAVAMEAAA